MAEKDPRLKRLGLSGFNKPKRTPDHPTKSHVVLAKGDGCSGVRLLGLVSRVFEVLVRILSLKKRWLGVSRLRLGIVATFRRVFVLLLIGPTRLSGNGFSYE